MNTLLKHAIFFLFFALGFQMVCIAQETEIQKADELFEEYSFIEAINIYEKLAEKDVNIEHIGKKLAQAYVKIGNTEKAEFWYSRVVVQERKEATDLLAYAQCLKYNGKYKEADVWTEKYAILNENDLRGERQKNSFIYAKNMTEAEQRFTIKNSTINSKHADFAPTFYKNNIAFASSRKRGTFVKSRHSWDQEPFLDLYFFEDTAGTETPAIQRFDGKINSKFHEGPSCFSDDGNTIYFTRSNFIKGKKGTDDKGTNHLKIYRSIKKDSKWGEPEEMAFNSNQFSNGHPTLSANETTLYFISDRPGGLGGTDIYACNLQEGLSGDPVNLGPEVNTEGDEMFPFIHKDGFLFFSSNGYEGMGGLDIYVANPKKTFFHRTENVGLPVNGPMDDFGFILDPAQKKGYFSSNRKEGRGGDDIYQIQVIKPFELGLTLKGKIAEKNTVGQKKIPNVKIRLMDKNNAWIEELTTNETGEFSFLVEPGEKYNILAEKEGYYKDTFSINTAIGNNKYFIETNLELLKDLGFFLEGKIEQKTAKQPLSGVKVTILDNIANEIVFNDTTNNSGSFNVPVNKKINDRISYNIRIEKEGYFTRSITFNEGLKEQGKIDLNQFINLEMDEIVLNKSIKIENIYFDSGKWGIRKDAQNELDNIVLLLKDNPTIEIELSSHTDSRGKSKNNLWLSKKRVAASAEYIVSKGIALNRITIKGYGEQQLINRCKDGVKCGEMEHQENRRTEFKVTKF